MLLILAFKLSSSVSLDTLYLTKDTTALQLIEARLLTNLITTYENPVADEDGNLVAQPGLYIEGLTDGAKKTAITTKINVYVLLIFFYLC